MVDARTREYLSKMANSNNDNEIVRTRTLASIEGIVDEKTKEFVEGLGLKKRYTGDGRMFKNPDNFYPELSPDYELWKSPRKNRY